MKDIKEKPAVRIPKNNAAVKIYKVALKKAWTEAKEKSRTKPQENTSMQENLTLSAHRRSTAISSG